MQSFPETELSTFEFADKRHFKRFSTIMTAFLNHPTASIPEACAGSASTKATYRFLDSEHIDTETLDEGSYKATVQRCTQYQIVLGVQDTTSLNFSTHPETTGLGYIDGQHTRGALLHSCIAVSEGGLPLGILDRLLWVRDENDFGKKQDRWKKRTDEKESWRWPLTEKTVEERVAEDIHLVMIADREADLYDYIARPRRKNCDMLIRWTQNRSLADGSEHKLFEHMEAQPIQGTAHIQVTDKKTMKKRDASLSYRWAKVTLKPPEKLHLVYKEPVTVWIILVREENPPKGSKRIEWKLMTTMEVGSLDDAHRMVRWYSYRWLIERFHYVLKSGCTIEKLQLEDISRLERAIVLYMIVAWRLLYITYLARLAPESSIEQVLEPYEWKALYCMSERTKLLPSRVPTIVEAVRMIAKLGGFLGRKGDGAPGVKVLWRGFIRLNDIAETYRFLMGDGTEKVVGNG